MKNKVATIAALALIAISAPAYAQFGSLPGLGGSKDAGPAVNTDEVKKTISTAVIDLAEATSLYQKALGNDKLAADLKATVDGLKSGSVGVNADTLGQLKSASDGVADAMKTAAEKHTKASTEGKKAAAAGLVFHVKATTGGVKGGKLLQSALSSKSMAAISALSDLKDFPGLLSSWTNASGAIFSYLKDNGVSVASAEKDLAAAMSDK